MVGSWQIFLVLMIVFVLFGAGKLPSVMADVGKGLRNLRQNLSGESNDEKEENKK